MSAVGETLTIAAPVVFSSGYTISSAQFIDNANSAYFLDPAATGTSLIVAGNVGIGTVPTQKFSVAGTIESTTGGFKFPDGGTQPSAYTTQLTDISAGITTTCPMSYNFAISNIIASGWTCTLDLNGLFSATNGGNGQFAMRLKWGYAFGYLNTTFAIEDSDDSSTWTTISASNSSGAQDLSPTTKRYVRFRSTDSSGWGNLAGVQVMGGPRGIPWASYKPAYVLKETWRTSTGNVLIGPGNVGIGTTAPLKTLDVAGSSRITGTTSSTLTGTADPTASTTLVGTSTLFTTELVIGDRITINAETRTVTAIASATSLTVDTAFTDTASASITKLPAIFLARLSSNAIGMVVNDLGNVGIGTTGPGQKLEVAGSIKLTGAGTGIIFNDGTTQTTAAGGSFVGVRAKKTADQSGIPITVQTVIVWGGETYDTTGFHDNTTNNSRITIPTGQGGFYLVNTSVSLEDTSTSGDFEVRIRKNGTTEVALVNWPNHGPDVTARLTDVIQLTATDYIEVTVTFFSGANTTAYNLGEGSFF